MQARARVFGGLHIALTLVVVARLGVRRIGRHPLFTRFVLTIDQIDAGGGDARQCGAWIGRGANRTTSFVEPDQLHIATLIQREPGGVIRSKILAPAFPALFIGDPQLTGWIVSDGRIRS